MATRLRNFCFTINNYTPEDMDCLLELQDECSYCIYGFEGKDKTPHVQGYCELKKQTAFSTIKKMIPKAHIEKRKGNSKEASDYCKKEGDYKEYGIISKPGKRNDLVRIVTEKETSIKKLVKDGHVDNYQQLKFAESLLKYSNVKRNPINEVNVIWIWGESGSGKTRAAMDYMKDIEEPYIWRNSQGKWFDGYDGESTLILDDLRPNDISWTSLLAILDRYPCKVEYKGGSREMLATHIIITCINDPKTFHNRTNNSHNEPIEQLLRRIKATVHKTK